jgi:uncharacterized membrane protein
MPHGHVHVQSHARPRRHGGPAQGGRSLRIFVYVVLAAVAVSTVAGLIALWPDHGKVATASSSVQYAAPGTTFPTGKIVALSDSCPGYSSGSASLAPGDTRACELSKVQLLDGPSAGRTISLPLIWPWATAGLHVGDRLALVVPPQTAKSGTSAAPSTTSGVTVGGVVRDQSLLIWALVLAVVVVAVGLLRGLMALVALGFSGFMLVEFILPALISGRPAIAVAVVGGSAIMFVVLFLAHGLSMRTSVALLGTLFGIALTAGIAQLAVTTTHLTGVTGDGGQLSGVTQIDFRGLLTCAIVIAGLGVLNDVTVTQASAVWELRAASPELSRRQLFAHAMRIGRDHIASTIYTIAFAYAGAAMVVLIVLYLYDLSTLNLLSQEDLATEIVRTLCTAIGLVLAVPVTTAIAALLVPAEVRAPEDRRLRDSLTLWWYSIVPRPVPEAPTRR